MVPVLAKKLMKTYLSNISLWTPTVGFIYVTFFEHVAVTNVYKSPTKNNEFLISYNFESFRSVINMYENSIITIPQLWYTVPLKTEATLNVMSIIPNSKNYPSNHKNTYKFQNGTWSMDRLKTTKKNRVPGSRSGFAFLLTVGHGVVPAKRTAFMEFAPFGPSSYPPLVVCLLRIPTWHRCCIQKSKMHK